MWLANFLYQNPHKIYILVCIDILFSWGVAKPKPLNFHYTNILYNILILCLCWHFSVCSFKGMKARFMKWEWSRGWTRILTSDFSIPFESYSAQIVYFTWKEEVNGWNSPDSYLFVNLSTNMACCIESESS